MFGANTQALREISLLQQLGTHPAIVQLLEVFTEPGLLYMVFQHVDRDLARHLQQVGKLPKASLLRYSFQLLSALAHCHARCISHRDIKPQNILLQLKTDEVKLCDFSLSRRSLAVRKEKQTQKVASLWYRSPEIFLGAEIAGPSLDIWSAACVMTEMGSGKPLFPGYSEIGMLFCQFEMLGTPSNTTWPGVAGLPFWSDEFPRFEKRALSDGLKLDTLVVNLLESMLQCCPLDRLAASILLTHPCFHYLDKTPGANVQHTREEGRQTEDTRMQTMLEDVGSPEMRSKVRVPGRADSEDGYRSRRLFAPEQESQKRFKPRPTSDHEGDVPNPLPLLAEEWSRSVQPSSFRF
eukprot:Skav213509  [mRNA]  locus=scaffold656:77197:78249:+ [translate_table: standard]